MPNLITSDIRSPLALKVSRDIHFFFRKAIFIFGFGFYFFFRFAANRYFHKQPDTVGSLETCENFSLPLLSIDDVDVTLHNRNSRWKLLFSGFAMRPKFRVKHVIFANKSKNSLLADLITVWYLENVNRNELSSSTNGILLTVPDLTFGIIYQNIKITVYSIEKETERNDEKKALKSRPASFPRRGKSFSLKNRKENESEENVFAINSNFGFDSIRPLLLVRFVAIVKHHDFNVIK